MEFITMCRLVFGHGRASFKHEIEIDFEGKLLVQERSANSGDEKFNRNLTLNKNKKLRRQSLQLVIILREESLDKLKESCSQVFSTVSLTVAELCCDFSDCNLRLDTLLWLIVIPLWLLMITSCFEGSIFNITLILHARTFQTSRETFSLFACSSVFSSNIAWAIKVELYEFSINLSYEV